MGLKSTLVEQMPAELPSKAEDLQLIQELTGQLEEAQQAIQTLQSTNSTLQSEKQKLLSNVTTAQKEIESLKSRAASVNSTELQNKRLLSEANKAKALADEAYRKAKDEHTKAENSARLVEEERAAAHKEAENRREAENKARQAEYSASDTKHNYKYLFIGNQIFTGGLAVLLLFEHKKVLAECGKWFTDRGKGIAGFFAFLKSFYFGMATGMQHWKWPAPLCFVVAAVIFLAIVAFLALVLRYLIPAIGEKLGDIGTEYNDGQFKATISVDIALLLFFVCLCFYAPIKAALHWNIFSLWLIFTTIGVLIWNAPEIIKGSQGWFSNY